MQDIFSASWESLQPSDVEAFLADATEEGLLWEAKGREQPNRGSVRKAACGFANSRGGFLILGAEQGNAGWTLPGLQFEVEEPGTWLSSVLNAGLNPVPSFDVKVWDRDQGRKAVVLRVEPVGVPPCLTSDGIAYARTSGQTNRITDPTVLARLTERGEAARERAEAIAQRAASGLFSNPPTEAAPAASMVSVAMATTAMAEDRTARLFNEEFARKVFVDIVKGSPSCPRVNLERETCDKMRPPSPHELALTRAFATLARAEEVPLPLIVEAFETMALQIRLEIGMLTGEGFGGFNGATDTRLRSPMRRSPRLEPHRGARVAVIATFRVGRAHGRAPRSRSAVRRQSRATSVRGSPSSSSDDDPPSRDLEALRGFMAASSRMYARVGRRLAAGRTT
jgi:hypothetical protein